MIFFPNLLDTLFKYLIIYYIKLNTVMQVPTGITEKTG